MALTIDDLTVNFKHLDRATLLEDWTWFIGSHKLPVLLAACGDAFVQDSLDGSVHVLDVTAPQLIKVAESGEEFQARLHDKNFVIETLGVHMVVTLQNAGITLGPDQIYSFKKPIVLGGKVSVENVEATDIQVHFSVLGQLHRQVKELPPGTPISRIQSMP
ncbi:MAG: T6SS immunity protein Tdi1 domain-containing protein [Candidatus Xenobia bacterium]